jgi:hypothetical protein
VLTLPETKIKTLKGIEKTCASPHRDIEIEPKRAAMPVRQVVL